MSEYTANEIADILFQKPERITKDLPIQKASPKGSWGKWFEPLAKIFSRNAQRDERSLDQAIEELQAIGMPEPIIDQHVGVLRECVENQFVTSSILLFHEKFFLSRHISYGTIHHLGFRDLDPNNSEELKSAIRRDVEEKAYESFVEILNSAALDYPQLLQTDRNRPAGITPPSQG